ncbi:hypothetical protein PSHT_02740 [Puccinia striiformis]|uniref:Uncharacterized protein n=1 Tax=Puccinia striiformis TaxID=27350 RepID=A0A2S4WH79_9BASI|nr:hypothetical protein PSHT_02740 [Puccinia striiformis]
MTTEELRTRILLTPDNYLTWMFAMEAKLIDIDAYDIVTGVNACSPDSAADKKKDYMKLNRKAYSKIVDYLSAEVINYSSASLPTSDRHSGYGLWQLLRNKDIISLDFATESFDKILKKLENYGIQNKIDSMVDPNILVKPPVTSMYTKLIDSDLSCPHSKPLLNPSSLTRPLTRSRCGCSKNNPSGHQAKSVGSTSKPQHSSNMVMTEEDEDAIDAIYDRYPDLCL